MVRVREIRCAKGGTLVPTFAVGLVVVVRADRIPLPSCRRHAFGMTTGRG
jgi:hypothetical protein